MARLGAFLAQFSPRQKAAAGLVGLVLVAGGTVGGVVAASGSPKHAAETSTPPPPPPSTHAPKPKPRPKPKPKPKPPNINPFTGIGHIPKGPVIAVKIDDTANGRPQRGIGSADIVYIEQAEGGLTRLVAVFATHKPTVEAVRSVRASDPELLTQYGPITLVASGGGGDSLPTLDKSILHSVINDRGGPGFGRDGGRPVPYNLSSNLGYVSSAAHSGGAKSIGFTWSSKLPKGSQPGASVNAVVGGTPVTFRWSSRLNRYVRMIDGSPVGTADGGPVVARNVIVQFCRVSVNPHDIDVTGNPSQYTHSVGSGRVVIFRNGRRITGLWSRRSARSPTIFKDKYGHEIPLAPGGAYVVLATNGSHLS